MVHYFRGSQNFDIANLFQFANPLTPLHFFCCFQPENQFAENLNSAQHNPYLFKLCGLKSYVFRCGDVKFPSSTFSCSENVKIHSTDTALSPLDKYLYISYLKSMSLEEDMSQFSRFSYTQYLLNGAFFISVNLLYKNDS